MSSCNVRSLRACWRLFRADAMLVWSEEAVGLGELSRKIDRLKVHGSNARGERGLESGRWRVCRMARKSRFPWHRWT